MRVCVSVWMLSIFDDFFLLLNNIVKSKQPNVINICTCEQSEN